MRDNTAGDKAQGPVTGTTPGSDGPPPMPRWVKILGVVLLAVLLVAVLVMLVSGGDHGPGRHGALAGSSITGSIPSIQ